MATRYVRQGAVGANNGTDWTNAYTTLSGATKTRGDLLYVASGSYGTAQVRFTTANSGTTTIEIRKATVADHGTATGWLDSYAIGQATFGPFFFATSWWIVDGITGGGPDTWTTGHGFKLSTTAVNPLLDFQEDTIPGNITVRHTEVAGNLNASGGGSRAQDGIAISTQAGGNKNVAGLTFSHLYIHDVGRCPMFLFGSSGLLIEKSRFEIYNWDTAQHSELMSTTTRGSLTFRYNLVTFCRGTGALMWDNSTGHAFNLHCYGNVFYRAPSDTRWDYFNGLIGGWSGGGGEDCFGMRIYHNTFINIGSATTSGVFGATNMARFGDNIAQNNLFVDSSDISYGNPVTSHNFNHYINAGGTHSEASGTSAASGNPFVDKLNLNFRLTANTTPGTALGSPYDVDMYGTTRTSWTRGAIEFNAGGDTTAPTAPSSLLATAISTSRIDLSWTASTDNVAVTNYLIERALGLAAFAQIGTSATTTFSSTGLTESATYRYQVRATDAAGNLSGYSNIATQATLTVAPAAPTGLTIL